MNTIYHYWKELCSEYTADQLLIEKYFSRIKEAYTEKHRHYHNVEHIRSMIDEIENCNDVAIDKNALLFATWFHDIVYNPKKYDNEQLSADFGIQIAAQLRVPKETIEKIEQLILATANHVKADSSPDLNFFLDCDLKVLGMDELTYALYAANIREEYKHVPSFIYKRERKKILKRFLDASTIYRTNHFQKIYETQARINIANELKNL